MRLSRRGALAAIAGFAATIGRARAQAACAQAPALLALADYLLSEPADAARFFRDRHGADAAYLKIRHGGLSYADGMALLTALERRARPPLRIAELKLAFARTADRAALVAAMPPNPGAGSIIPLLGASVMRALVVEDGGDWLFDEIRRWRAANRAGYELSRMAVTLALTLDDLDDSAKSALASRALAADAPEMALQFLERKDDLADWLALANGMPEMARDRTAMLRRPLAAWGRARPLDMSIQPAPLREAAQARPWTPLSEAMAALARRWRDAGMIMTFWNQSGDPRVALDVAAGLTAAIDAKRLDPANAPDGVIIAMVEGLDRTVGREDRIRHFAAFDVGVNNVPIGRAGDHIDAVHARTALGPFVSGAISAPPAKPDSLSPAALWPSWVAAAEDLRAGRPAKPYAAMMAVDLMETAGRQDDALALLRGLPDWQEARRRAHRLMADLDVRCGGLLAHPVPFSDPLYRFGPR